MVVWGGVKIVFDKAGVYGMVLAYMNSKQTHIIGVESNCRSVTLKFHTDGVDVGMPPLTLRVIPHVGYIDLAIEGAEFIDGGNNRKSILFKVIP